jgi:8-oxo-dGTP diphosphatase
MTDTNPKLRLRPAGLGLVVHDDKVLMIQSNYRIDGSWTLPGGGQEPGETIPACVEREVLEETGVTVRAVDLLRVRESIPGRDPRYPAKPKERHRIEFMWWCEVVSIPDVLHAVKPDEGHTAIEWIPLDDVKGMIVTPFGIESILADMVHCYRVGLWSPDYLES